MAWTLFFDGDCAFCSRSARLAARLDKRGNIRLAPLQGTLARELGFSKFEDRECHAGGTMVILREPDGVWYLRSDAVIELGEALGGMWRIARLLALVPRPLRDGVYRWIARHRGRLVHGGRSCALTDPAVKKRLREPASGHEIQR